MSSCSVMECNTFRYSELIQKHIIEIPYEMTSLCVGLIDIIFCANCSECHILLTYRQASVRSSVLKKEEALYISPYRFCG